MTTTLRVKDFLIESTNQVELRGLITEVFSEHSYYFESSNRQPVIIDLGAHVGVATLYFKMLYPEANITAVEPNPSAFALLESNLANNGIYDVKTIAAAIGTHHGSQQLHVDQDDNWLSTASFSVGAWNASQQTKPIEVPVMTLRDLITEPVDLLKMDIEGAEFSVLMAASSELKHVKRMIVEFHPGAERSKEKLVEHLAQQGFELVDSGKKSSKRPFQLELLEFKRLQS